jgi:hypothetical protein
MSQINLRRSTRRARPTRRPDSPVAFSTFLSSPPDDDVEFQTDTNTPSPGSFPDYDFPHDLDPVGVDCDDITSQGECSLWCSSLSETP